MKTIRRKLDEIGGIELNNKQKLFLKGGDELPGAGTCAAYSSTGSCFENLSRFEAIFMAGCDEDGTNCNGGGWCCDSCDSVTWLPCVSY
jgi:hypothetical protein